MTTPLGPDPELSRQARQHWGSASRPRKRDDSSSGKWAALSVELKPLAEFYAAVRAIAARAAKRGEIGEGGGYVWSLTEWQYFCKIARASTHPAFFGNAVLHTVRNVETMIADGKTAREIHALLYWRAHKDLTDRAAREGEERLAQQRAERAAFEAAVQEKIKDERARKEARRRVDAEYDDSTKYRRSAV